MNEERMRELLKIAVNHIENFEDTESKNVLKSLGFTENELAEITLKIEISEEEKENITMVEGKLIHNGELIWQLSDYGSKCIFSDQREDEESPSRWITECIPFKNYSHYFHIDESRENPIYTGFAWYSPTDSYVKDFKTLEECLDWLVPEREILPSEEKENDSLEKQIFGASQNIKEQQNDENSKIANKKHIKVPSL